VNYIIVSNSTGIETLTKDQIKLSVYPNPIQTSTLIGFTLTKNTVLNVSVYDVTGKLIKVLTNTMLKSGENKLVWDGTSSNGQTVANGQYFIKFSGEDINITESVVLNK